MAFIYKKRSGYLRVQQRKPCGRVPFVQCRVSGA